MLITYLRKLTAVERDLRADIHLGLFLAFIAGAMNAGGFVVINQYTSHMTGLASMAANAFARGNVVFALAAVIAVACFIVGAACTAIMINWARVHQMRSEFALPLIFEAMLLLLFGFVGLALHQHMELFVSLAVMLLCFMMGVQNAMITKISRAVIRTTHITGVVTDLGIELGKLVYWNRKIDKENIAFVRANRQKMVLMATLFFSFMAGGVIGAYGFQWFGFFATIPLALLLLVLAAMPFIDDVVLFFRHPR